MFFPWSLPLASAPAEASAVDPYRPQRMDGGLLPRLAKRTEIKETEVLFDSIVKKKKIFCCFLLKHCYDRQNISLIARPMQVEH